jgi:hypothetical protein
VKLCFHAHVMKARSPHENRRGFCTANKMCTSRILLELMLYSRCAEWIWCVRSYIERNLWAHSFNEPAETALMRERAWSLLIYISFLCSGLSTVMIRVPQIVIKPCLMILAFLPILIFYAECSCFFCLLPANSGVSFLFVISDGD